MDKQNATTAKPAQATIGAGCLLIQDQQVLLVSPNYGRAKNAWILPGGYAEAGETPALCALRELKEETGQVGSITAPFCVRYRTSPALDVYWVFKAHKTAHNPLVCQTEELLGVEFWPLQKALESPLVRPMTKYFIKCSIEAQPAEIPLPEEFTKTDTVYFFRA